MVGIVILKYLAIVWWVDLKGKGKTEKASI